MPQPVLKFILMPHIYRFVHPQPVLKFILMPHIYRFVHASTCSQVYINATYLQVCTCITLFSGLCNLFVVAVICSEYSVYK